MIIAKVAIHKSALYVYMRPKLGESGVCARRQFLKLAVVLQEADIAVSTVDDGDDLGSIAAAPTQAQQSPLYNSITGDDSSLFLWPQFTGVSMPFCYMPILSTCRFAYVSCFQGISQFLHS